MSANSAGKAAANTEAAQKILLDEVFLGLKLAEKGIRFNPEEINPFQDQTSLTYIATRRNGLTGFTLPHGISASSRFNKWTPYSLVVEDNVPVLYEESTRIGPIKFNVPHPVSEQILSGGEKLRDVVGVNSQGGLHVMYSAECSLKDKGEDCLFCGFNERAKDGNANKVPIKSARQIAEAYDYARRAGVGNHFRITGGFVPERRELEYYLDVADAIKEKHENFYGVAIIGAPSDLSVIPKYKEAGFKNISHNIEVWDRNIFAAMCPGKEKRNGGWQHWVDALEYSVEVFGKGNVHSNLVGGLEPITSALEGIEYLASKGVICHFSAFRPQIGTPLEGYRSPEARWHYELLDKGTNIFRRYGFSALQLYSGPASGPHSGEVYRIKDGDIDEHGNLREWKFPSLD